MVNSFVLVENALQRQPSSKTRGNLTCIEHAMKTSSVMHVEKNLAPKEILNVIRESSIKGFEKMQAKIQTQV